MAAFDAICNDGVPIVVMSHDVRNIAMFKRLARRRGGGIASAVGEGIDAKDLRSRLMPACGPSTPSHEASTDVSALRDATGTGAAPLPAL